MFSAVLFSCLRLLMAYSLYIALRYAALINTSVCFVACIVSLAKYAIRIAG